LFTVRAFGPGRLNTFPMALLQNGIRSRSRSPRNRGDVKFTTLKTELTMTSRGGRRSDDSPSEWHSARAMKSISPRSWSALLPARSARSTSCRPRPLMFKDGDGSAGARCLRRSRVNLPRPGHTGVFRALAELFATRYNPRSAVIPPKLTAGSLRRYYTGMRKVYAASAAGHGPPRLTPFQRRPINVQEGDHGQGWRQP